MKKEDLLAQGLTEEQVSYVMAENGKDIERVKTKLTAAETARDEYKEQLEAANTTIQSYKDMDIEGIKQSASDWEKKYNDDLKAMQDKLEGQAYDFALKEYVSGYQFTSDLVKEAVIAQLKAQGFKLNDGKFLGADDFMKQLKEANPSAFADAGIKQPKITLPGTNTPPVGVTKEDFKKMTYAERMKIFTENRELYNELSK